MIHICVYETIYIFIRKRGQRFVYICSPHQVKKMKKIIIWKKGKRFREIVSSRHELQINFFSCFWRSCLDDTLFLDLFPFFLDYNLFFLDLMRWADVQETLSSFSKKNIYDFINIYIYIFKNLIRIRLTY